MDGERGTMDDVPADLPEFRFGTELRRRRVQRGLSLTDLARQIHYSKGYLSKIENGTKPATADLARRCDELLQAQGDLIRLALDTPSPGSSTGPSPRAAVAASAASGECPYRGLAAFGPQHAQWFFGRERATASLVTRLTERFGNGCLVLVAPSGVGKSSLLRAGLMSALRRGALPVEGSGDWPTAVCTPTTHPLKELTRCCRAALDGDLPLTPEDLLAEPRDLLNHLRRALAARCQDPAVPVPRLVLVVDQFEELFTLCTDEAERYAFVQALSAIAGADTGGGARGDAGDDEAGVPPAVVVLGLRADFCGRCLEYTELAAALTHGLFALAPMNAAELRDAITRPAKKAGLVLEPGLVELLLRDVDVRSDGRSLSDASVMPSSGALPLLSHALLATWQQGGGGMLTVAGYETTGGIHGAIATTADNVFTRLTAAEQDMARRVLVRLVHLGSGGAETRRRMDRDDLLRQLPNPAAAASALDALVVARLITVDRDAVEFTHEALLRAWPRLRGWIDADRVGLLIQQQLAEAAVEWEQEHRDPAVLYRGTRLAAAREWAENSDGHAQLSARETEFLAASCAEEARLRQLEQRHARQQHRLMVTLAVLLVLAVSGGCLTYWQRSTALEQRRSALSQAMAAQSATLATGHPEASLLMAVEAFQLDTTTEARGALLSTQVQYFSGRLTGHTGPVNAVAFAPDGRTLATGSSDGTVKLWRVSDRRLTATLGGPGGAVRAVAFSPDGRTLASAKADGTVRIWGSVGHQPLAVLTAQRGAGRAVAYSPDGRILAAGGADGTVTLWDTGRGLPLATLTGHRDVVNAVAFSPDGRILASAGSDRTVRLWDTTRHTLLGILTGHSADVLGVAFSPDGRTLASGSADRTVRIWDTADHRSLATLVGHSDDVNAVTYTDGGAVLVSASGDGTVKLWDVASRRVTETLSGHTDYVLGVAASSHGDLLATAGFDQSAVLWDLGRATLTARPFTEVWKAAFSPDGRLLATADGDCTVKLWDVAQRRLLATLSGHDGSVFGVAFSPDGRLLATAGADRTVKLWDVGQRKLLATLTGHTDFVNAVAFAPDGRTLASASDDLTLRLWDLASRRPPTVLTGHTGAVQGIAFAPDGRTLASSSNDGTVRLWDLAQRRTTATLVGHTGSVRGVAFAPDGRTVASSGNDSTVRLWDVARGQLLATLTGHRNAVWGVAFAPDGHTLASSSNDGTVRLWDLDVQDRTREICGLVGTVGRDRWDGLFPDLLHRPHCPGA